MSVAAAEAGILRQCLKDTTSPALLPKRYFAAQARFQINPWWLAVCNDLRFSSVVGERTPAIRTLNWYRERLAVFQHRKVQQRLNEVDFLLQGNAREKRVDAQGKPFELLASDLRHAGPSAREALLLLRAAHVRCSTGRGPTGAASWDTGRNGRFCSK
jgi:hypothetical protein